MHNKPSTHLTLLTLFRLCIFCILLSQLLLSPNVVFAHALDPQDEIESTTSSTSASTRSLHLRYLSEARKYRSEGRYELARQSYVLALSIASKDRDITLIRKELDGLELLLRTLR